MTFYEETEVKSAPVASAEEMHDLEVASEMSSDEEVRSEQERELEEVADEDPAAAADHFEEFKAATVQSEELQEIASSLEEDLDQYRFGKERDSVVALINELGMESIRQWQYAEMQLRAARNADPAIEVKTKDPEFLLADAGESSETSTAVDGNSGYDSRRSRIARPDSSEASSDEEEEAASGDGVTETVDHVEAGGIMQHNVNNPHAETVAAEPDVRDNKDHAENKDRVVDGPSEASVISPEQSVGTTFSYLDEKVVLNDPTADQRFQDLRMKIGTSQKRTIELFTEGVQLNNQALQNREKNISLMLEAERTQDRLRKRQLSNQAEGFQRLSDECSNSARDRFAEARQLTQKINSMHLEATALIEKYGPAASSQLAVGGQQSEVVGQQSQLATRTSQPAPVSGSQSAVGGQQSEVVGQQSQLATRNSQPASVTGSESAVGGQQSEVVGQQSQLATLNPQPAPVSGSQSAVGGQQSEVVGQQSQLATRNSQPASASDSQSAVGRESFLTRYKKESDTLRYTVQVGVYRSGSPPARIAALPCLRSESIKGEAYRFSTGVFISRQQADSMRQVVVKAGMKDAFVTVIRGGSNVVTADRTTPSYTINPLPVQPVNPGAVTYRIQLGAFKGRIPYSAVEGFIRIFEKGIDRQVNEAGYQVFYSGNYGSYENAVAARDEAIAKGVKDAFVVALKDGKRISITKALLAENR
jgi:HPt (histidine-containing phosphotransfer) domain-containing protein